MKNFNKKWKIFAIIMAVLLGTATIFGLATNATGDGVSVFNATDNTVTALSTGDRDLPFSNGYRGFCLDRSASGAYVNDEFVTAESSSAATSNVDNRDVSQYLKIMFTQCFADIFVSDGNGNFVISDSNTVQAAVWHFTEDQYVWGNQKKLTDAAKNYSGSAIPDNGYTLTLNTGETITFYFKVMQPNKAGVQDFFAYQLKVTKKDAHVHVWSEEWSTNDNQHWHECDCGEKSEVANHDTHIVGTISNNCVNVGYTGDVVCKICTTTITNGTSIDALGHDMGEWYVYRDASCTEAGIERSDCLRKNCEYFEERKISATGHKKTVLKAVSPTCTTTGKTEGVECSVCGEVITMQEIIPALGHVETLINTQFPSCTTTGYVGDVVCGRCSATITIGYVVPELGHDMSEWHVTKQPTCSENGEEQSECLRDDCEYFETRVVDKLPHVKVTDIMTAATCTANGKTEGCHCSSCGEIIVAQEVIPMLGHDMIVDDAVAPTCTAEGLTEGSHCSRCDYTVAQEAVDALGHNMGEWYITKQPTCTEDGEERCDCVRGDYFETRPLTMTGHTIVVDEGVEPTCTATGLTEGTHCDTCNTVIVKQEIVQALGHQEVVVNIKTPTCVELGYTGDIICSRCDSTLTVGSIVPALGHEMGEWYVTKQPTCNETGTERSDCQRKNCTHYEVRILVATGHNEKAIPAVAPSCENTGLTEGVICSTCNTVLKVQEVIDALGHTLGEETVVTCPTCIGSGENKKSCTRDGCEYFEIVVIQPNGHGQEVLTSISATCTTTGLTEGLKCSVCDVILVQQEIVPALGHNMIVDSAVAPDCVNPGLTAGGHCSRCDYKIVQESIPAHGHSGELVIGYPATCLADGLTNGETCTICNFVLVEQEVIPALGHNITIDVETAPTCLNTGLTKGEHCTRCDYRITQEIVDALGHDMGDWYVTKQPTCTEDGEERCDCIRGDHFETRPLTMTGHTIVVDEGVEPTCTTTGLTEGKHCNVCNTVLVAQETVNALGHDMGDWYVTKQPTCTEDGEERCDCVRGDYFETRPLTMTDESQLPMAGESENPKTADVSINICWTMLILSFFGLAGLIILKKVKV